MIKSYRAWTEKDIEQLNLMSKEDIPIETVCKKLNRSKLSILNQLTRMSIPKIEETVISEEEHTPLARRKKLEKAAVSFLDMKIRGEDYKDVWGSILNFQEVLEEKSIEQKEVSIKIPTNKWIGISFLGDLHIGNMATDYKTMLEHRDLIAKTPNLYCMLNGDYCDNFIPSSHPEGMFEALFPPAVQKKLAKDYIEAVKDKVLALCSGDHEVFSLRAADFDLTEYLAKHGDAAYLGNGGTVYLNVGKTKYKIMMRHRYRYGSQDNPTSTVKKMFEKCGGFDVGVTGHNHVAALEEGVKEGMDGYKKRIFLRCGTYKTHDRYGRLLGFSEGDISAPVVLFSPEKRDLRAFSEISEGVDFLEYLNSGK